MILYHGTNALVAQQALDQGLTPRGKRRGNWKHTANSCREAVYLTDAYPLYFGIAASEKHGHDAAIIEIDTRRLNPFAFAPDEDVLAHVGEQLTHPDIPGNWSEMNKIQRSEWLAKRLHHFAGETSYKASLRAMGTCAYLGSIPPDAIRRIAFVNKRAKQTRWTAMDPVIAPINYRLVGKKYRALTKWIFGDELGEDAPEMQQWLKMDGELAECRPEFQLPPAEEKQFIMIMDRRAA